MDNFPASIFMTDFEIVEIENEYIRNQLKEAEQERIRRIEIEEQARIAERNEIERLEEVERIRIELENERLRIQAEMEADITENEIENRILHLENAIFAQNLAQRIRRIIPYQDMGPIPINITPPSSLTSSSSSPSYNYEDYYDEDWEEINHINDDQENQENQESDENDDEEDNHNNQDHQEEDDTSEAEYQDNLHNENAINIETTSEESTISNTSINTCNESYNSAQSKHSDTPTASPDPEHFPSTDDALTVTRSPPLPLRRNDISFVKEINELNRTLEGKASYVLSSIRPCFASSKDQDFFICHICHAFPRKGDWIEDRNEHPFVRNVGSIFRHLRINHCGKPEDKRQLTEAVETYILSFREKLDTDPVHPLFQLESSIPKSLSMSCIHTAWKSNQTEITKHVVNKYYFNPETCGGHKRLFSTKGPVHCSVYL